MTREFFAGAMFGEVLPSGERVLLYPGRHLDTHRGIVAFPEGEKTGVWFPRITNIGGFKIAGQLHDTKHLPAVEWVGVWRNIGDVLPSGVNPVIYDWTGNVRVNPGMYGSQGFRCVTQDQRILTGDDTYGPWRGLSQYTPLGDDLWVGQAHLTFHALVLDGSDLRVLEVGSCTFIRANREDEKVAISISKPDGVLLIQTTMAELRTLPILGAIEPTPTPVPVPVPEPSPVSTPNRLDVVRAEFETHPPKWEGLTDHEIEAEWGRLTRRVAWALNPTGDRNGWGLLSKTPGEGQYDGYAIDAIIYGPTQQVIDILAGTRWPQATPAWQEVPKRDINHWAAPINPVTGGDDGDPGDEDEPKDPPPPVVDVSEVLAKLNAQSTLISELIRAVDERHADIEAIRTTVGVLAQTVIEHAARPAPKYEGSNRYLGRITLEPKQ